MTDFTEWVVHVFLQADVEPLFRLFLAALLGGLIGLERERSGKAAGLRTNALICVGSTLIMEVSRLVAAGAEQAFGPDPGRIAAQVVSGIGFIGAGTILVARGQIVVGLTTAATIWVVAAVGLAVGVGAYGLAVGTTLAIFMILVGLRRLEDRFLQGPEPTLYEFVTEADPAVFETVLRELREAKIEPRIISIERRPDQQTSVLDLPARESVRERVITKIFKQNGILRISRA